MFSLFEVLAVMCMAGFGLFAFRRYLRRGSALAVLFASFSMLLAVAPPASATEFRKGDNVNVKKDEVIKGDIFLTGEHVRIDGDVEGDVYAFAHQVDVSGHINGDLICFAQAVRVNGVVDGNLRAGANNVTLTGTVERNVMVWNETFNLDASGKIGRSLTAGGETLTLDGKIGRDFLGFADSTTISGFIGGSVQERGKSLSIVSGAEIDGKTAFKGHKEPNVASDAKLASPLEFTKIEQRREERSGGYYLWQVIWAAAYVLFGLVLFSLMPKFSLEATANTEHLGASAGLGILVGAGFPIGALSGLHHGSGIVRGDFRVLPVVCLAVFRADHCGGGGGPVDHGPDGRILAGDRANDRGLTAAAGGDDGSVRRECGSSSWWLSGAWERSRWRCTGGCSRRWRPTFRRRR